jgi:hypothetical protein
MGAKRGTRGSKETPATKDETAGGLSFDDVGEAASFLVRIFGEEAREIAALRAEVSPQKDDWRRVGDAVDEVLQTVPRRKRTARRRLRPFK